MSETSFDEYYDATVIDRHGEKIGGVGQVYLDEDTGDPTWVTVKTGLFGLKESFVPVEGRTPTDGELHVPFDKDFVKDAPRVDPDAALTEQDQEALLAYYATEEPLEGESDAAVLQQPAADEVVDDQADAVVVPEDEPERAQVTQDVPAESPHEEDQHAPGWVPAVAAGAAGVGVAGAAAAWHDDEDRQPEPEGEQHGAEQHELGAEQVGALDEQQVGDEPAPADDWAAVDAQAETVTPDEAVAEPAAPQPGDDWSAGDTQARDERLDDLEAQDVAVVGSDDPAAPDTTDAPEATDAADAADATDPATQQWQPEASDQARQDATPAEMAAGEGAVGAESWSETESLAIDTDVNEPQVYGHQTHFGELSEADGVYGSEPTEAPGDGPTSPESPASGQSPASPASADESAAGEGTADGTVPADDAQTDGPDLGGAPEGEQPHEWQAGWGGPAHLPADADESAEVTALTATDEPVGAEVSSPVDAVEPHEQHESPVDESAEPQTEAPDASQDEPEPVGPEVWGAPQPPDHGDAPEAPELQQDDVSEAAQDDSADEDVQQVTADEVGPAGDTVAAQHEAGAEDAWHADNDVETPAWDAAPSESTPNRGGDETAAWDAQPEVPETSDLPAETAGESSESSEVTGTADEVDAAGDTTDNGADAADAPQWQVARPPESTENVLPEDQASAVFDTEADEAPFDGGEPEQGGDPGTSQWARPQEADVVAAEGADPAAGQAETVEPEVAHPGTAGQIEVPGAEAVQAPAWQQPQAEQATTWQQPTSQAPTWQHPQPDQPAPSWQQPTDPSAAWQPEQQAPTWQQPQPEAATWQQPQPDQQAPTWQPPGQQQGSPWTQPAPGQDPHAQSAQPGGQQAVPPASEQPDEDRGGFLGKVERLFGLGHDKDERPDDQPPPQH